MKRYTCLIKKLLEFTEQKVSSEDTLPPEVNGYTTEQVHYHVGLCYEAGYMNVRSISGADSPYKQYVITSLTWEGHEALDRLRTGCP